MMQTEAFLATRICPARKKNKNNKISDFEICLFTFYSTVIEAQKHDIPSQFNK